jgi:thiol-disulfide isomerase/thioredoxin
VKEVQNKEKLVTLGIIGAIVLIALAYTWNVIHKAALEKVGDNPVATSLSAQEGQAPYTDMLGNELSLTNEFGNVLVVNSWASWSPDSAKELSAFSQLAQKYADKGVKVLAINRAEPKTTAERFLRTIGADGVQLILDPDDRFYHSIGGYAMPETVIYDVDGNVFYHHHGIMTAEQMEEYLQQALVTQE